MRLIDADAIPWVDLNADNPNSKIKVLVTFADKINKMPTIEERKTGKWIPKSTNGEMFDSCSVCGYVEWDAPRNYCPNCGAMMS